MAQDKNILRILIFINKTTNLLKFVLNIMNCSYQ